MPYEEKKKHINKNALVSIITPLYNAAPYIAETISSIQKQTYGHWEQIIVDDASTDNSAAIAKEFAGQDSRIKFMQLSANKGAAYCRNEATKLASGDYIAFLDADDLWSAEKLSRQLQFMQEHDCDVCYTSYLHIGAEGKQAFKRVKALPKLSYKKQHRNNYVGNLTGIYRAATIGKIYAPNIRKRQDWAVWLEAIRSSKKSAMGLQEDLAFYRVHKDGMSANKMNLIKYNYRFYNEYLGHSKIASAAYLIRFFFEYFFVRTRQIEKL